MSTFPSWQASTCPKEMSAAREQAPRGSSVSWGFRSKSAKRSRFRSSLYRWRWSPPRRAGWFSCTPRMYARWRTNQSWLHLTDARRGPAGRTRRRLCDPLCGRQRGAGRDPPPPPDRRLSTRRWGENCFEAVAQHKALPIARRATSSAARMGRLGRHADARHLGG